MKDTFYLLLCVVLFLLVVWKIRYEIIDYFEEEKEDPYVLGLVAEIQGIDPRVQDVIKKLKFYKGRRSYTINKQSVYICKSDENNVLYNKNQLILVLIHEIAHAINKTVGHDDSFKEILADLLQKAEAKGIYNSNIPHVQDYCNY